MCKMGILIPNEVCEDSLMIDIRKVLNATKTVKQKSQ